LEVPAGKEKRSRSHSELTRSPGIGVTLSKLLGKKPKKIDFPEESSSPQRIKMPPAGNQSAKVLASLYDVDELKNERNHTINRIGDIQEQIQILQKEMDKLIETKNKLDIAIDDIEEKYNSAILVEDAEEIVITMDPFVESPGINTPFESSHELITTESMSPSSLDHKNHLVDYTKIEEVPEHEQETEIKTEKPVGVLKKKRSVTIKKTGGPAWEYYIQCHDDQNIEKLFTKENLEMYKKFDEPDSESNIILEESGKIKYANIFKLIEKITNNEFDMNHDAIHILLLTYRSFMNGVDLLNILEKRYNTPPCSADISEVDFAKFYEEKLYPIRKW
jgi:hypothetical protein